MKKFIFPSFALFTFITSAQTFVSTSVENKNIILEEFTGISCGYCPDGHAIGQGLHASNPNDVFLINIHAGNYATPQGAGTDFKTSFGAAIASQSGLSGYPAGTVNRHQFTMSQGGGTAMSRGDWSSASTQLLSQVSPVNVGLQASIDMATNTLTVDVEVYYTGTQTISSNRLNIAIVQNGILGPQSGGAAYNPTAIDPVTGLYTHQHMLRHMLTGQWGENITNITPGSLYSNTYTWTIPNQISGYPLSPDIDATNLAIVAFVSEGNQEILSGTEVYPSLVFVNSYDANLINSSATDIMCSSTTDLTVDFKNYGNTNLTSLDIEYSINGGSSITTYPWTGNLTPGASETVIIPNISLNANLTNTVDVSLANPNGNTDQNLLNNNLQCTFNGVYDAPAGDITIQVLTDGYPSETSWKLKENGTVIAYSPTYTTQGTMQAPVTVSIIDGNCYEFTIEDSDGDGLLSPGNYKVIDANGSNIVWGGTNSPNGNFTSAESTHFGDAPSQSWNCTLGQGCSDPGNGTGQYISLASCQAACSNNTSTDEISSKNISIFPNPVKNTLNIQGEMESVEIFDVFGKLVLNSKNNTINTSNLAEGVYVIKINTHNNIIITKRITVTK